jgi:hypothetical protein
MQKRKEIRNKGNEGKRKSKRKSTGKLREIRK